MCPKTGPTRPHRPHPLLAEFKIGLGEPVSGAGDCL
jgi:hypothetical protein